MQNLVSHQIAAEVVVVRLSLDVACEAQQLYLGVQVGRFLYRGFGFCLHVLWLGYQAIHDDDMHRRVRPVALAM